ncbi:FAD-dependent urate hydroxylase [Streptomyces sp. YIM 130001]|uniref:FAD-dependent monooxygenase n=1 Tax=Streptomyces sp. YIM 130001 TaxID=2259644 RepID=UPI000E65879D|nr:FAD-dependent monooxygenase [Streptomyces sp. YIM 130001]RII13985.1 FAD-dependent urate hydroxylase [Streptomyces sp. YIM 130001]
MARALIIGGGIGGLTAAVALHRRGWQVTVLERAASLEPVGAGISLAPNGQRALDVIGLGDPVRELAAWQGPGGLRTPGGRWLARTDSAATARRFGSTLVLLHRATLIDRLRAELPQDAVRVDSPAELTDPGGTTRPATVTTTAGEEQADLVVGADGINSQVRRALFPDHPGTVYAGFTTWRCVVPSAGREFAPHETWGRGRLWGSQPLKDGRIYAYAAAAVPAGGSAPDSELAELRRVFGGWHQPIPAILDAAAPEDVLRNDVRYVKQPLPAYHRGRVALLGDAAHAMPPSLGQGGNQAIEDAVVLAHHTPGEAELGLALAAYTRDRLPRTMDVVRRSVRTGRATTVRSRAGVMVRDTVIAGVGRFGGSVMLRSFDGVLDWQPPERTYAARPESH